MKTTFRTLDQAKAAIQAAGSPLTFLVWNGMSFEARTLPTRPGCGGCLIGTRRDVDTEIGARFPSIGYGMHVYLD